MDELRSWLVSEMHYPGPLPTNQQLEELSTGSMKQVWGHLIKQCKSEEKTRIIRSNILIANRKHNSWKTSLSITTSQLSQGDDGGERDDLMLERSRLTNQLHTTMAKIDRLRKDIHTAEEYKLNTLQTKSANEDEIRRLRQSYALLNLYRKQVQNVKVKIDILTEKLSRCCDDVKEKEKLAKAESSFSEDINLETPVDRKVRQALDVTSNHLQLALLGSNSSARKQIRDELQKILTNIPGVALQNSIIKTIQLQIDKVIDQLKNFDMKKEAEALKMETEQSQSGALVSFVRDEVYQVTQKFLQSHKELTMARKISKERETELEKLFTENQENILDLQELKSSLSKSFENGAAAEKIREISKLEGLLHDLEVAKENQDEVVTWTRNSEANVQEMLNLISVLIESKSAGYKKLATRKGVTEELVKCIPKTCSTLSLSVNKSINEPEEMMKTFMKVPVTRYTSTAVQDRSGFSLVPTQDLAINRLRNTMQYPGRRSIKGDEYGLTNSINSTPNLTSKALDLTNVIDDLDNQKEICATQTEEKRLLDSVKQMPLTLHSSKQQQERDFVPLIRSTGEKCEEGVELCKHVEAALAEHHSQIAQEVVGKDGDLLVEGRTLTQWQEALRVAILNT